MSPEVVGGAAVRGITVPELLTDFEMDPVRRRALVDGLRGMFPAGSPLPGSSEDWFVEVRERQDEAVVLLRWVRDAHLYGVPIDLTHTGHDYYDHAYEVASDEEWLDSGGLGLMVSFDTGFRARARRRRGDDRLELRAEDGWPVDDSLHLQVLDPVTALFDAAIERGEIQGDPVFLSMTFLELVRATTDVEAAVRLLLDGARPRT